MKNPRLRIVLVDSDFDRRLSVEKNLSYLGYHRVVPLNSLRDLFVLLDNAVDVFDLLVVSGDVVLRAGIRLDQILHDYSCIKHSLVYQSTVLDGFPIATTSSSRCAFAASGVPDRRIMEQVMSVVDRDSVKGACHPRLVKC